MLDADHELPKNISKESNNELRLTSPDFNHFGIIPDIHRSDYGENKPPILQISGIPDETKSLAMIMEDEDNPGPNLLHWIVWNIPPDTNEINGNDLPNSAVVGKNDLTLHNYYGPCPLQGKHHYSFQIFALDTILDLPTDIDYFEFLERISSHVITDDRLVGVCYSPEEFALE